MAADDITRVRTHTLPRSLLALAPATPRPSIFGALREAYDHLIATWTPRERARRSAEVAAQREGILHRVLEREEFDHLVARERSLANRGTRLFCVLVMRRTSGDVRSLTQLARRARQRLRATDLVAHLDTNRVAVLLADTGSAGALAVSKWVQVVVAELGLEIDPTIYVYPSVQDDGGSNGPSGGSPAREHRASDSPSTTRRGSSTLQRSSSSHTQDRLVSDRARFDARKDGNALHGARGRASSGEPHAVADQVRSLVGDRDAASHEHDSSASHVASSAERAPEGAWRMEDLWVQSCIETPRWKRALDILFASLILIALTPLFAIVATAIWLDSPGPVIFRQKRAGRGGRPFTFYKFRSMFVDAESRRAELMALNEQCGPVFKMRDDPRMTRVGRILRRWSIDELPQIWNVLKGDISLVGPRSPTMDEVAGYERWQRDRLRVSGGLTCIWQVSGRSQVTFREWMRMDMRYVSRCSLWLDVTLLARTLPAVLSGRGAY